MSAFDKASQCDIPSVAPLLARSMRAVFAGDPMQLRHVSTLDAVVDQTLLEQHGLTAAQVQHFTYRVKRFRACYKNPLSGRSRGNETLIFDGICRLDAEKSDSPHVASYF